MNFPHLLLRLFPRRNIAFCFVFPSGLQLAWDPRRDQEFSEKAPKFLNYFNYVQYIFPDGAKIFRGELAPVAPPLSSFHGNQTRNYLHID